jgi:surface antigen
MRATLPIMLLAAGLTAACQTTQGPDPQIRTGEGMVDPATGTLLPEYNDGSFALSFVVEERTGPLSNADRREMDAALDRALAEPVAARPTGWMAPLSGHEGEVDVADWTLDRRAGELCGTIRHAARLERAHSGAVTICRASIDPAWRIDEVAWDEPKRTARTTPRREAPTPDPDPEPETRVIVIEKDRQTKPSGEVNYGVGDKDEDPAPARSADCEVEPNSGAQTLGDCLAPG